MRDGKRLPIRPLHPRPALLALIVVTAAVLETLCLNGTIQAPAVAYFSYLYSTYALIVFCAWLPGHVRRRRSAASRRLYKIANAHPCLEPVRRFLSDAEYRLQALLYPSLAFNLLYGGFKLAMGVYYRSWWMTGVGFYYIILAGMRFGLLRHFLLRKGNGSAAADWRLYRRTAWALLALTLAMSGLITQTVLLNRAYDYPGTLIYAFALYAFIKIGVAAPSLIRHRNGENRVLAASRSLSFACALMSILALQTAMIHRFGGGEAYACTANALTGLAVCLLMLGMCLSMLLRSRDAQARRGR
ncbi:MAG: hypothetical protein IJI26_09485 [Clostridia bacterium]|nr:hypothetical protein [Clostridia bacterium]